MTKKCPPRPLRPAPRPASEIVVDQKQSFELVRTVISATISNVAFLREIFPDDCYKVRVYDFSDPDPSYDTFMNGSNNRQFTVERSEDLVNWRVLVRGTNPGVDKFLDWLEIGVEDALKRKYLAMLQLSFYNGEVSPSKLVEAYILTFTYDQGVAAVQLGTETKAGKKTGASSVLLSNAKKEIRALVNNVVATVQELPELPPNRVATMHLSYNSTCPKGYDPPGFLACPDSSLLINDSQTARLGAMTTGHHSVRVKLFSKNVEGDVEIPTESPLVDGEKVSIDSNHTGDMSPMAIKGHRAISTEAHLRTGLRSDAEVPSDIHGPQTQEDGLKLLRSMGMSRNLRGETQDTQPLQGALGLPSTPQMVVPRSQGLTSGHQPYSQAVIDRAKEARQQRGKAHIRSEGSWPTQVTGDTARLTCECGVSICDSALIQCDICGNFQHIQCYGYLGSQPSTAESVCYTCLLESEETLLSDMKLFCLYRRTLYFLREKGSLAAIEDLAAHLNSDATTTNNILAKLEREGYLKQGVNPKTKRKGKAKPAKPVFDFVKDDLKLRSNYFRPELKIAHHFAAPDFSLSSNSYPPQSLEKNTQLLATMGSVVQNSTQWTGIMKPPQQTTFIEGSSTQGTPSPPAASAIRSLPQSHPQTPAPPSSPSTIANGFGDVGTCQKRPAEDVIEMTSSKRVKNSSAKSPWVLHRRSDD